MITTELVAELSDQGVTDARVITTNRSGVRRPTAAIILTFSSSSLPREIKAGFVIVRVTPYIPNPLRCFKCQGYGHHQSTCKRTPLCAKCSLAAHEGQECSAPIKCSNCGEDYPSYAPDCSVWQREKDICRVKVEKNISFPEARKQVTSQAAPPQMAARSYASVTKTSRTIGTQTDVIRCKCIPDQIYCEQSTSATAETQTEDVLHASVHSQQTHATVPRASRPNSSEQRTIQHAEFVQRVQSISPRSGRRSISIRDSDKKANLRSKAAGQSAAAAGSAGLPGGLGGGGRPPDISPGPSVAQRLQIQAPK
jgi:hypothetical protein